MDNKTVSKILLALLLSAVICTAAGATEVLDMGMSARSIALGRCFVGMTGSGISLFGNPAGLETVKNTELNTMYGEMSGDVRYTMLGVALPSRYGQFGFGYAGNKAWDLVSTTVDANGRVVPLTNFDYGNDLFLFGYGNRINNQLSYGLRLKYNSKGSSSIPGGMGNGINTDIGFLFKADERRRAGIVFNNVISGPSGAIKWGNGYVEDQPMGVDLGLGYERQDAAVYADISYREKLPIEMHVGSEWDLFSENMKMRLGFEQKALSSTGTYLTAAMGLGYKINNFSIDYAYHYDGMFTYNSRHFVSLSFVFMPLEPKMVRIDFKEGDRIVTTQDSTALKGIVNRPVKYVMVAGQKVIPSPTGVFQTTVPLKIGKNTIPLSVFDDKDRKLTTTDARVLRLRTFDDVNANSLARDAVFNFATMKIVSGVSEKKFRPTWGINRAEIATILGRAKGAERVKFDKPLFKDVSTLHWAASYIKYGIEQGWIKGYTDNTFKPLQPISRAEGVEMVTRFAGLPTAPISPSLYSDVKADFWAAGAIQAAKNAGLLDYIKAEKFEPKAFLTRAEICYMLSKTKYMSDMIKDLYNFNSGY